MRGRVRCGHDLSQLLRAASTAGRVRPPHVSSTGSPTSPQHSTSTSRCATDTRCRPRRSCSRSPRNCDGADEPTRDLLMGHFRVGVQWDTEVTLADAEHIVTQVYCSALPVAYTSHPARGVGAVRAARARRRVRGHVRRGRLATPPRTGNAALVPHTARCRRIRQSCRMGARCDPAGAASVCQREPRRARRVVRVAPIGRRRADRDGSSWTDRLFETPPHQWGNRGDPHLWRELQAALAAHPETGHGARARGVDRSRTRAPHRCRRRDDD